MSGLETAIRTALERSDRLKADVRARIYQSARQALESGLQKQGVNDPETVAEQRHRLEATIHAIEQEERERLKAQAAAVPPTVPVPPPAQDRAPPPSTPAKTPEVDDASSLSFGVDRDHAADDTASFDDVRAVRDDHSALGAGPAGEQADLAPQPAFADKKPKSRAKKRAKPAAKPRRRSGFFSRLFVFVVIISSVGIAAWWVYSTGLLLSDSERQTGELSPQPTASEDDFAGDSQEPKTIDPQRGFSKAWIETFQPRDAKTTKAGSNATADVLAASDGQALRVVSGSPDMDGSVTIPISSDVLRDMMGKTSMVAITVQAVGEKPVQFAVSCAFGRLGGCSRHRFTANLERSDFLFRVTLPDSVSPNAPGDFVINTDMNDKSAGINIYSMRVLPGQ